MAAAARPYHVYLRLVRSRRVPETRGECLPGGHNEARPCRFTTCRYHAQETQAYDGKKPYGRPPRSLPEGGPTCTLDVAAEGEHTMEEVGEVLGLTRQRVEQIEKKALRRVGVLVEHEDFER